MQKIVPHLWFDKEAKEAAEFYTSIFPESKINYIRTITDTPSGDCDTLGFTLWNQDFMSISAGPLFRFNPSVSFMVNFDPLFFGSDKAAAREKLDEVWNKLSDGGSVLMALDSYPFSERYGWVSDKYGLSWQLILSDPDGEPRPAIVPSIMFVGNKAGKAQEAIGYYTSVFKNSKAGTAFPYGENDMNEKEENLMYADLVLENTWFAAMDSSAAHDFDFNEAISFLVNCNDQEEIDYYWNKLSADPSAEQCGWLKDKFGLSWQISPTELDTMMRDGSDEQVASVTQAFLPMKKMEIAPLRQAFERSGKDK